MKLKTSVKEIRDEELLNLIDERDEIDIGTQVVVEWREKEVLLEVVEINDQKVWWQIV